MPSLFLYRIMSPPLSPIYLAGPTASGKSAVAMALARRLGRAAIVNADAFQLYQGLSRLSAAPEEADRSAVPHHLYGILAPTETCDAATYASMAREVIDRLLADGVVPLIVGGSGLYLKALTHGLAPTPPGDAVLREQLDSLPLESLVAWLTALDPVGAAATNLKNRRYVTRNLEITLLSGQPASRLKQSFAVADPEIRAFVLTRSRDDLYRRIDRRAAEMLRSGAVEEVAALNGTPVSATAEKAIGFREIRDMIAGRLSPEDCLASIAQATRRYAKRQETWFRREKAFQSVCLSPSETPNSAADRLMDWLRPVAG